MSIPALLLGPHLLLVVVDEDDVLEVFFFGPLPGVADRTLSLNNL